MNRWENETETMHAPCGCGKFTHIMPSPAYLLKHWINMQNLHPETKFRLKDFLSLK